MSDPRKLQPNQGSQSPISNITKDEWEDWEDDEIITPIEGSPFDDPLVDIGSDNVALSQSVAGPSRQQPQRASTAPSRISMSRIRRPKSRHRQKATNAKFGIKLVTDMSILRQQQQQQQQQQKITQDTGNRMSRTGKFVDAAALLALEGKSHDNSTGAFDWLKRRPTKGKKVERVAFVESPAQSDLSPSAAPIMIGFQMPKDSDVVISPQTAVVETPVDFPFYTGKQQTRAPPSKLPVSAWSPDTEDSFSPQSQIDAALSSRAYEVPAVPDIPRNYQNGARNDMNRRDTTTTEIYFSDDDDMGTPVTLFEEDGSPVAQRKSYKVAGRQRSTTVGSRRSQGWWDQVTSPFVPTPATPRATHRVGESPAEEKKTWWGGAGKKTALSPVLPNPFAEQSNNAQSTDNPRDWWEETDEKKAPSPAVSAPSFEQFNNSLGVTTPQKLRKAEDKKRTFSPTLPEQESADPSLTPELPPPYSPPSESKKQNVRYRAVFPPGHQLNDMYPPSPGPVPPGLSATMTSQGAISLADVPLTQPPVASRLPDRPAGSALPGDHFYDVSGRGVRQKTERKRRRHEKEDVMARKTTRMWRGRGCFSSCGCCGLGQTGAAGRKRRRVWLGLLAALVALTVLGVVLGVVLSRRKGNQTAIPSRFLNLTDFPPMPTGISTVVGPGSDTTSTCVNPPTLWSCSLPKEQSDSVKPFSGSQPSFVFHIQFDNDTRRLWDIPPGETPRPTPTSTTPRPTTTSNTTSPTATSSPRAVSARSGGLGFKEFIHQLVGRQNADSSGFTPIPSPPTFAEMFFLGNTTDGVVSKDKAGEPTPFYITMLQSVDDPVGPNALSGRDIFSRQNNGGGANISNLLPPPELNSDRTGAPARLLPFPKQQPVRLYDRGLPTERYSFYTYYNKTIYVQSIDGLRTGDSRPVAADQNGGSLRTDAKFVVTWLQARYKVEIWTRKSNNTRLVGGFQGADSGNNKTQPGTFPFPVTITLDTHGGGDPRGKFAFLRRVDERQRILLDDAKFVLNGMNTTGDLVNPGGSFNPSFGGFDGGTGGCKCQYTNFVELNRRNKSLLTLAIETSCDDTCVAILEKSGPEARLLFNKKVTSDSREHRGIHPVVAAVGHTASLADLVQESLHFLPEYDGDALSPTPISGGVISTTNKKNNNLLPSVLRRIPDFISVTRGPGMTSGLAVGLTLAKGLSVAWQRPFLGVHHMQAHALTPRLVNALDNHSPFPNPEFPFLTLLISGGHTQLLLSQSLTSHSILATTANVAIGDMLDKCAREILPAEILSSTKSTMYGAALEKFASLKLDEYKPPQQPKHFFKPFFYQEEGQEEQEKWHLTPPHILCKSKMEFDFSGLGGAVRKIFTTTPTQQQQQEPPPEIISIQERQILARETMRLSFEQLAYKTLLALQQEEQKIKTLVISGGVASNNYLRTILRSVLNHYGFSEVEIVAPPPDLCTDNAAMIAWTGMEMWEAGWESELDVLPLRKWGLDETGEDGGIMGVGGWKRREHV
ncbi:glycoprotease family-domain-containing protein [Podospora fimiseda]|uniref:Glycoprotease family-domain-containing protein n=1 Tax=Podospora fimiseda TaxID=252190 RepID=A0AAN7BWU9_9PEZI|nr:glycoprotease family-domain-containing protein [Podospora fimiseda]